MALWQTPRWFDARRRSEQVDDYIQATGTARFGIRTYKERDKYKAVMRHFNRVAPRYDFMNSLLSMGIQHVWKRAAIRLLNLRPGKR